MKKVLVTYYTRTNTTKEVGEKIAKNLGEKGLSVDIKSISEVDTVDAYDAVIIGSPIHGMRWAKESVDFVAKHEAALAKTKVAYYQCCYPGKIGGKFWQKSVAKAFNSINSNISPIATGHVGGRSDKPMTGFPRILFGIKKDAPIDCVDWDEVNTFTNTIASALS